MAAFEGEVTTPPQVFEGAESVSIIVQSGEVTAIEPGTRPKPRVITTNARVVRK